MTRRIFRALLVIALLASALASTACGQDGTLFVSDLLAKAQSYNGKQVTVNGAYVGRAGNPGLSVLAPVVGTLDNGLDAQPAGDQIWLEGFPEAVSNSLHQPGDAIYGFVRVSGQFDAAGGYGPDGKYQYRIRVTAAEPIERIQRKEVRVTNQPPGAGKVALLDLLNDPAKYNGQTVTTQGYYFWNGVFYVLAEGVSTEEDGSNPQ